MERLNDEIGWNQLRYDIRTYTAQNERNRRGGEAGKVPDGYKYIGDRCFLNNGKVHEVVLPEECRIIGKQAFEKCKKLSSVTFKGKKAPTIGKAAFKGIKKKANVQVAGSMKKSQVKKLQNRMKTAAPSVKITYKKKITVRF